MKKKLFWAMIVGMALGAIVAMAEPWLQVVVPITTNLTTVTLDDVYEPPAVLDGFMLFPNTAVCTNTMSIGYTHNSGTVGTTFYSVTSTNTSPYVKDLGLVVRSGDILSFTNSVLRGKIVLNFKRE